MQGSPLVVGLVYWPGGMLSDWGTPEAGLNPCNETVQANLVSSIGFRTRLVMFAAHALMPQQHASAQGTGQLQTLRSKHSCCCCCHNPCHSTCMPIERLCLSVFCPRVLNNLLDAQTAAGAMFATYSIKADRLTVLKTSFAEELILTGRSPSTAPKVISMVAFR